MGTTQRTPSNGSTATIEAENIGSATLLDSILEKRQSVADRYKPVLSIKESIDRFEEIKRYVKAAMIEGEDYGHVPGVEKPFLFQAGAQKLCVLFGYVPRYETEVEIEDWSGAKFAEPLYYYRYRCILERDGAPVGQGIGSASSWESKYRYRWVSASEVPPAYKGPLDRGELKTRDGSITEFAFAIDKAETNGQYGKPAEYWAKWQAAIESGEARKIERKTKSGKKMDAYEMGAPVFRVPNPDIADVINTVQKMGLKRSLVGSTISATGLSALFSQDEDSGALEPTPERREETKQEPRSKVIVDEELEALIKTVKAPKDLGACFLEIEKRLVAVDSELGRVTYDRIMKRFTSAKPDKTRRLVSDYIQVVREMWAAMKELVDLKEAERAHNQSAEVPESVSAGHDGDQWPEGKE